MKLKKLDYVNIYEFEAHDKLTKSQIQYLTDAFSEFKSNGQKIRLLGLVNEVPFPTELDALEGSSIFTL